MNNKKNLFDIIKIGDTIKSNLSNIVYTVAGFYGNKYGVVLSHPNISTQKVCKALINSNYTMNSRYDNVNNPAHYASGGIECIDAMIAAYGKEAVMHFCQCNAFKYQWRFDKKNGIEDLNKAIWYNNKYIELKNGTNIK